MAAAAMASTATAPAATSAIRGGRPGLYEASIKSAGAASRGEGGRGGGRRGGVTRSHCGGGGGR